MLHRVFHHLVNRQATATTTSVMAVLAVAVAVAVVEVEVVTQVAVAMVRAGLVARVRFLVDKFVWRLPLLKWVAA